MDRITRPRVFLSHSKKDIAFIERLERDLRKCQIEPWLDDVELRHGKPWLDAIFEDGIPSCDAVLVYFTENSLASKVVKKELDAGVISQLEDGSVALLPYVESAHFRGELRSDIKALQVPEWNDENFETILARCVAEVWRSFHERRVIQAIAQEKVKRMEAERELERSKEDGGNFAGVSFNDLMQAFTKLDLVDFVEQHADVFAEGRGLSVANNLKEVDVEKSRCSKELTSLGLLALTGFEGTSFRPTEDGRKLFIKLKVSRING